MSFVAIADPRALPRDQVRNGNAAARPGDEMPGSGGRSGARWFVGAWRRAGQRQHARLREVSRGRVRPGEDGRGFGDGHHVAQAAADRALVVRVALIGRVSPVGRMTVLGRRGMVMVVVVLRMIFVHGHLGRHRLVSEQDRRARQPLQGQRGQDEPGDEEAEERHQGGC